MERTEQHSIARPDRAEVEAWYAKEMAASGMPSEQAAAVPYSHKWLAYVLVFALPVSLAGCGSNSASAYDECVYEQQKYGYDMDCDDDSGTGAHSASAWYYSKGYRSKSSAVDKQSSYYKSRSGIGKSSGFFSGGG
ncbi:hypothetical protein [Paenibacillus kobensis]|uniref:hypothetical protein n=1 Tax=Paenibacillus kobensis TaxID=59841 RepID=UPI000FD763CB|nr:hypothetical protein [Paenibacillus kobensis]